jgi:hypothetical protein
MALNRSQILIIVSLCIIGTAAFFLAGEKGHPSSKTPEATLVVEQQVWASPDPRLNEAHDYKDALVNLEAQRVALASRYQRAPSAAARAEVRAQARIVVARSVYVEIFPSWYGTPWDFNGTTEGSASTVKSPVDIS